MSYNNQELSSRMAHAIRFLSADAIEKSKSGHPCMPLGMADAATVLSSRPGTAQCFCIRFCI